SRAVERDLLPREGAPAGAAALARSRAPLGLADQPAHEAKGGLARCGARPREQVGGVDAARGEAARQQGGRGGRLHGGPSLAGGGIRAPAAICAVGKPSCRPSCSSASRRRPMRSAREDDAMAFLRGRGEEGMSEMAPMAPMSAGAPARSSTLSAFIDHGSEFEGKLTFKDTVRIDGSFRGEISSENTLVVGESGEIMATVRSRNV